jgi:Transmembrane secretion effector
MTAPFAPLRLSGFRKLATAYAINDVGDMVGAVALAILVFDRTGDALATTALFVSAKFVPALLAPALTARLDNLATGRTLGVLHALEAVFFLVLALLATSAFSLAPILVLALADGVLALTARSLMRGSVAGILEPAGLLREGNAIFNVIFAASTAAGPALAGLLIAWQGVDAALLLDAASFALVALLLFTASDLAAARVDLDTWLARVRRGLGHVRADRELRLLLIAQAAALVFFACVVPIEVVYAKETLDAGDAGFGALLSAWGVGIVAGSMVFAVTRKMSMLALIAISTLAIATSYLGQAVAPSLLVACAFAVVGGVGNGVQGVAVLTAVQLRTPKALQARVAGLLESLGAAMPGAGFILGGLLTAAFDPRVAFATAGVALAVVVLGGALALGRSGRRETASAGDRRPATDP